MINLPRKLIYQPRTDIKDYIEGNKLNKALYEYLDKELSLLKDPRFGRKMVDKTWRDIYILRFFNDAYYFCILASCDNRAMDFFRKEKDEYVFQISLVILSLQQCKNDLVERVLEQSKGELKPSYKAIIEAFRKEGITFRMNLRPMLPDLNNPSVDWQLLTDNFSQKVIPNVIELWKEEDKKRKVCSNIWDAFRNSSEYGKLEVELDDTYFEDLMKTLSTPEDTEMEEQEECSPVHLSVDDEYAWVRMVVDYAKGRRDWLEAEPFHKMLNHLLRGTSNLEVFKMVDEIELHFNKKENQKRFLFGDAESNRKEAERFKDFLEEQKIDMAITSAISNPINMAFVALCRYRKLDEQPNGNSCYRFLKDECGLAFKVNEKTYANFIRDAIKEKVNDHLGEMPKLIKKAYKDKK